MTENIISQLQQLYPLIDKGPDHEQPISSSVKSQGDTLSNNNERLLFVVEDDPIQGQELCLQLTHYGYITRHFTTASETISAARTETPDALLLDIMLPEGELAGTQITQNIKSPTNKTIPTLFISARKDWEARLAAVRSGSDGYLCKPIDISILVDQLDRITQRVPREPYRVLVIDDVEELARHYSLILRQAGMMTEVISDPSVILEQMQAFKPDLILLDFYLPGITGVEVAKVLRQDSSYHGIPIVFLSTETDPEIQLQTLQQGDDFLQKPILDNHLVRTVESRAERARSLSQLMYHDGLTGLLNQITLKQRLETELNRSQRQKSDLCYVMIDLDFFKKVNDTYGHVAGDQVIKSLSQLLRKRLRKSDQIGRYGGEEFGIILPDTPIDKALQIIDDLRQLFMQISYYVDQAEFSSTFSAGVSCSTSFTSHSKLIEAADEALYLAKNQGRNRVVVHPSNL